MCDIKCDHLIFSDIGYLLFKIIIMIFLYILFIIFSVCHA